MSTMQLYTHPHSRGVTVSWMLEECQADYQAIPLQFRTDMKQAEYLKLNPAGKVPTLVHDGVIITETAAIVAYLADLYADKQLAPAVATVQRGEYYKWLFIICNQFEPALTDQKYQTEVTDEMRFSLGYPELDVLIKQVTEHLSQNRYLLGEQFSAADLLLVALLAWGAVYDKIFQLDDTLQAYLDRAIARPAYLHTQQLNDGYLQQLNDSANTQAD